MDSLDQVCADITACRTCPRLVQWREDVATEKRASFRDEEYWGKGVPGFGDANATVWVMGLAPAAHGANRTGRMFTGDRSGDWLYRMYMTFATVFIAQSYGIDMSMADQIQMMLILLITSKGVAGVPRASLVVIAGMLSMFNIPGEGLLLLLAVDQILDMGRSATNVVGNAVASAVVAKWEGEKFKHTERI